MAKAEPALSDALVSSLLDKVRNRVKWNHQANRAQRLVLCWWRSAIERQSKGKP